MTEEIKKNRTQWNANDDAKLIDLWARHVETMKLTQSYPPKVYHKISEALGYYGVETTPQEVRFKLSKLVAKYRKVVISGGDETDWIFFKKMEQIVSDLNRTRTKMVVPKERVRGSLYMVSPHKETTTNTMPMSPLSDSTSGLPDTIRTRRIHWSNKNDQLFLDLWASHVDTLRDSKRHGAVYRKISQTLNSYGIRTRPRDVKFKINNLVTKYRKLFRLGKSSEWVFYEKVQKIVQDLKRDVQTTEESPNGTTNSVECVVVKEEPSEFTSEHMEPEPDILDPFYNDVTTNDSTITISPSPSCTGSYEDSLPVRALENLPQLYQSVEAVLQKPSVSAEGEANSSTEMLELEREKLATLKDIGSDIKRLTNGVMDLIQYFKNKN